MKMAVLALALVGCGSAAAPPRPASSASPLAAVLGALVCPEVLDHTFTLASGNDGVLDTYVRVNRCQTTAQGDEFAIAADAYVWTAVDRAIGPVAVRSFVHGTLELNVRTRVSARDDGQRLVVTLAPLAPPEIAVETVGILDVAPQDWASLLAIELAPAAGVSPERVAKRKLNTEAERALREALAKPITVGYDARTGATSWANAAPAPTSAWKRLRVAPHGTAIVGPFPPSAGPQTVRMRAHDDGVAVRAICASHAEHLLAADRRGDRVVPLDWARATSALAIPPLPCPWVIAFRSAEGTSVVEVEPPARSAAEEPPEPARDRWVSLDELSLDAKPDDWYLSVVAGTDAWREKLTTNGRDPKIVILAPDEEVHLRLLKQNGAKEELEAEAALDLGTAGAHEQNVTLATKDGHAKVNVRVKARVRTR